MDRNKHPGSVTKSAAPPPPSPGSVVGDSKHPPSQSVPNTGDLVAQSSRRKLSLWSIFFIIVGVVQVALIAVFLYFMYVLGQEPRTDDNSAALLSIVVVMIFIVPAAVIALVNFIGLPVYLIKHRPGVLGMSLGIVSFLISAAIVIVTIAPMIV